MRERGEVGRETEGGEREKDRQTERVREGQERGGKGERERGRERE